MCDCCSLRPKNRGKGHNARGVSIENRLAWQQRPVGVCLVPVLYTRTPIFKGLLLKAIDSGMHM